MLPNTETVSSVATKDLESFEGVVVDVRIPEAYTEAHIEGAVNFPVYQVDFLEKFPEANPDMILQPCNLPEAQRIHNRRVAFSGQALKDHPLETLEGVTPFNLQEISDGMDGPHSDVSC